jgi:hypothetical protein
MFNVGDFACIRIDQNVFCKSLCNEAGGYATRLLVLDLVGGDQYMWTYP